MMFLLYLGVAAALLLAIGLGSGLRAISLLHHFCGDTAEDPCWMPNRPRLEKPAGVESPVQTTRRAA